MRAALLEDPSLRGRLESSGRAVPPPCLSPSGRPERRQQANGNDPLEHREAGGQLFAAFSDDAVIIKEATGPRWTDRRHHDRKAEQREIVGHHARGLHYVGDWHTHPSMRPSPSDLDYQSIRDSVRQSAHQLDGFVLIVVGTLRAPEGFHVSVSNGTRTFILVASQYGRST